jgi:23S rRNA (uracil1939-C5)-methyltransferase
MGKKEYNQAVVEKGDEIETEIVDLAYGGDSVARYKGMTVFIPYGVPGSIVRAKVTEVKRSFASARITRVVKEAEIYAKPECPYFSICGGCDWLNIKYEKQKEYKVKFIRHMLENIAELPAVKINPPVAYENPYFYRNRAQYKIARDAGKILVGFYRSRSHEVIGIDKCLIVHPKINEIAQLISLKLNEKQKEVEVYSEQRQRGYLRHVAIRVNMQGESLVTFVTADKEIKPFIREIEAVLKEKIQGLKGIVQNMNQEPGNNVFGDREKTIWGSSYIIEKAGGIDFKLDSASFFQINAGMLEKMAEFVAKNTGDGARVLDLYGGVGALTLPSHKKYSRIYNVEVDRYATEKLKETARDNKIENLEIVNDKAEDAAARILKEKSVDEIVIDPPRKGIHPAIIPALKHSKVKKIIYISCNPSTFARDMKELKEAYFLREVTPLDQFAQTYHVEIMGVLELKKSGKSER